MNKPLSKAQVAPRRDKICGRCGKKIIVSVKGYCRHCGYYPPTILQSPENDRDREYKEALRKAKGL